MQLLEERSDKTFLDKRKEMAESCMEFNGRVKGDRSDPL